MTTRISTSFLHFQCTVSAVLLSLIIFRANLETVLTNDHLSPGSDQPMLLAKPRNSGFRKRPVQFDDDGGFASILRCRPVIDDVFETLGRKRMNATHQISCIQLLHDSSESERLLTITAPPSATIASSHNLLESGDLYLSITDVIINESTAITTSSSMVNVIESSKIKSDRSHRRLEPIVGTMTLAVVRVSTSDSTPMASAAEIHSRLFGTDVGLRSQYLSCSFGQLQWDPAPLGVIDVLVQKPVSAFSSGAALVNAAQDQLKNDGIVSAIHELGDKVMFCLPPGTGDWAATAGVGHWRAQFNNKWCTSLTGTMHEIGHTVGLTHANKDGIPYNDQTGYMAAGYTNATWPRKCFNGHNNWLLGWYRSRTLTIDPLSSTTMLVKIATFVDYDKAQLDEPVLVNIASIYYLQYNAAKGFNVDTEDKQNQLTVTEPTASGSESRAGLSVGDVFQVADFNSSGRLLMVEVCDLTIGAGGAELMMVSIGVDTSLCNDTLSPVTSSPTIAPTYQPTTTKPSHKPTKSPSTSPTTIKPSSSPTSSPTLKPTSKPTTTPTSKPSSKPSGAPSRTPTLAPNTPIPTLAPMTTTPTLGPVATSPSLVSLTARPTVALATTMPTSAPMTTGPTLAPVTTMPTSIRVTKTPFLVAVTPNPTISTESTGPTTIPILYSPTRDSQMDLPVIDFLTIQEATSLPTLPSATIPSYLSSANAPTLSLIPGLQQAISYQTSSPFSSLEVTLYPADVEQLLSGDDATLPALGVLLPVNSPSMQTVIPAQLSSIQTRPPIFIEGYQTLIPAQQANLESQFYSQAENPQTLFPGTLGTLNVVLTSSHIPTLSPSVLTPRPTAIEFSSSPQRAMSFGDQPGIDIHQNPIRFPSRGPVTSSTIPASLFQTSTSFGEDPGLSKSHNPMHLGSLAPVVPITTPVIATESLPFSPTYTPGVHIVPPEIVPSSQLMLPAASGERTFPPVHEDEAQTLPSADGGAFQIQLSEQQAFFSLQPSASPRMVAPDHYLSYSSGHVPTRSPENAAPFSVVMEHLAEPSSSPRGSIVAGDESEPGKNHSPVIKPESSFVPENSKSPSPFLQTSSAPTYSETNLHPTIASEVTYYPLSEATFPPAMELGASNSEMPSYLLPSIVVNLMFGSVGISHMMTANVVNCGLSVSMCFNGENAFCVFVDGGDETYRNQALNAQEKGCVGVIFISKDDEYASGSLGEGETPILIPVLEILRNDGVALNSMSSITVTSWFGRTAVLAISDSSSKSLFAGPSPAGDVTSLAVVLARPFYSQVLHFSVSLLLIIATAR